MFAPGGINMQLFVDGKCAEANSSGVDLQVLKLPYFIFA